MIDSELNRRFTQIEVRLTKLEEIISTKKKENNPVAQNYKGLSGGIRFLIDQGFFNTPKSVAEIYEELKKEGYHATRQTVDSALRKGFVANKKILTRIKEKDVWKYVIRK